ncbi:helix-turn-helix transcriptional regulator [Pseudomonas tremae]|uniref:helix-turn-helix domain-containing protein n=1 Tax=Pseudomonas syringae group TaxID=136849 RepID=UPI0006D63D4C|nr:MULTISPECIES: helix-turn-helix transcriptional regulator [Pseudomonas syringae group]KPZ23571.1 Fis family transcriptional regulator [Pseudomonas coronafaciens pv. zizaniae]MCQ2991872.1 helix-turn-helix transcriptional regulator [Pseudomonas tremae]RMS93041.1 Fis family transcriptional regulator [Pseudomonas coronafaciens pv. oryzae]RMS96140.1 Fis family transcriptional regulator [Pseudomonas coronafaciens pv. oryzae]
MSIQDGFAAALRWIRVTKELTQKDVSGTVAASHVSQLEAGKTSPTVKVAGDLALALGLSPSALLAAAAASNLGETPRAVLMQAIDELERLGLIDTVPPASAQNTDSPHPTSARAALTRSQVQELKKRGLTQVAVANDLGIPRSTVQRHWH